MAAGACLVAACNDGVQKLCVALPCFAQHRVLTCVCPWSSLLACPHPAASPYCSHCQLCCCLIFTLHEPSCCTLPRCSRDNNDGGLVPARQPAPPAPGAAGTKRKWQGRFGVAGSAGCSGGTQARSCRPTCAAWAREVLWRRDACIPRHQQRCCCCSASW
jgi:hypothetical protein